MYIDYLKPNKRRLAEQSFYEEGEKIFRSKVELCGEKFETYSPNFNGGSLSGNCKILIEEEFEIINTFDEEYLSKLENEITYIKKLINNRRLEFKPVEIKTKLRSYKHKDGNKKMCCIYVEQYEVHSDTYGDYANENEKILERFDLSDTKQYQDEIEETIKKLEEKYNVKANE